MGPLGSTSYFPLNPDVTYDFLNERYLIVWKGSHSDPGFAEFEIFGAVLKGDDVSTIKAQFRISDMGPEDDTGYSVGSPRAAFTPDNEEFLVVWAAENNVDGMDADEMEVFGQFLDHDGDEIRTNDFRISDIGGLGNSERDYFFGANTLALVYNSKDQHFLVLWISEEDLPDMANNEYEVFGQLLSLTGAEIGENDFRISWMGPSEAAGFENEQIAGAFDTFNDVYVVMWSGEHDVGDLVEGENEIFFQIFADDGRFMGQRPHRISEMGPASDPDYDGRNPETAFDPANARFLAVWRADDDRFDVVEGETEVYGQLFQLVPADQLYLPIVVRDP